MRVLVATDAWLPQVNGVVRTYERLAEEAPRRFGADVCFLSPLDFRTVPMPSYPEIRLALPAMGRTTTRIDELKPDAIHIATEGTVGLMARAYCKRRGLKFTTCYHTRFPEYVEQRWRIPTAWSFAYQRWFHNSGNGTMVPTSSMRKELDARGFLNLMLWTRGVDTTLFHPREDRLFGAAPVFLYVGRVAVEKNLEAFLSLDLPGRKVVVGDGPARASLERRFRDVHFTGERTGEDLARCYASADVFVFPSRTETFGIVLLEATASGLPVAAYPVTGPLDVVVQGVSGILSEDLRKAALACLDLDRRHVARAASAFSWGETCRIFLANIDAAHSRAAFEKTNATGHAILASRLEK